MSFMPKKRIHQVVSRTVLFLLHYLYRDVGFVVALLHVQPSWRGLLITRFTSNVSLQSEYLCIRTSVHYVPDVLTFSVASL